MNEKLELLKLLVVCISTIVCMLIIVVAIVDFIIDKTSSLPLILVIFVLAYYDNISKN